MKARKERLSSEQSTAVTKVWDGFQWVDRAPVMASLSALTAINAINSSGNAIATVSALGVIPTGNQKDRRIYVGNLPGEITGRLQFKSLCICIDLNYLYNA